MSFDWRSASFQDLCDITRGASPRPIHDYLGDEGMPWIKIADATAEPSRFISSTKEKIKNHGVRASVEVFPGDLILSNSATPGLPKFMKINACIHDGWMLLRNFKGLDKEYAYWLLLCERVKLVAQGNGSVFTNLKTDILKSHVVKIPPIKVQVAVANALNLLDDRITLLRETNATLEAIAQALFKSWFVDFDPVRAKAEGRKPEGMDATTAALFPDSFEESELGLVPKGWRWAALADAYEMNPARKLKKGEVAPYLDMSSAPTSGHCSEAYVQREMGSGAKFTNGDTLLARITPCLENGKSAFVDFLDDGQNGWGSTEFIVLRPKAPLPEYHGYLLARHTQFRDFAVQCMSGTSGRQRIQNDMLGRFLLALPTESVANAFSDFVMPIQKSITANHKQAQTLGLLRDTLLPRLISGQLRLPDAEHAAEEALA